MDRFREYIAPDRLSKDCKALMAVVDVVVVRSGSIGGKEWSEKGHYVAGGYPTDPLHVTEELRQINPMIHRCELFLLRWTFVAWLCDLEWLLKRV